MAFNKMFVMLPVMFAARKLDGENPDVIFFVRCAYGAVQTLAILTVLYVYSQASAASSDKSNKVKVYVPPPPQPFADPNAKMQLQEKILSEHLVTTARGLLGSTLFGICMTVGLHLWKGMLAGLAIQSVMAPFNLIENALVSAVFMGGGLSGAKDKKIFGEKHRDDLTDSDEVVDGEGKVVRLKEERKKLPAKKKEAKKSLEEVLLDTWDMGEKADVGPLMEMLNKKNVNFATSDSGWTPVMILSGLGAKSAPEAMRKLKELGANPAKCDKEGWNALHWAAFHGSAAAAEVLLEKDVFDGIALSLHEVQDKEGKTATSHAKDEGNDDVARVIEEALPLEAGPADEGLRKRK